MSVVLVTGCSSGIGEAVALHFARRGARTYATMRSPSGGSLLREAATSEGLDLRVLPLDVRDDASVGAAAAMVTAESGGVDVLVNNAGIARLGSLEETPMDWYTEMLDTNVSGVVRVTKALLPSMRERGSGTIVNVSSVAGVMASAIQSAYCASKFALEGLSVALAQEVAQFGIRVIVVRPGFIATPTLQKAVSIPDEWLRGPYGTQVRRRIELFEYGARTGDDPSVVAEVIQSAIDDPHPRFRYLAGDSAAPSLEGHAAITEEEWIATGLPMSDEEYGAAMGRIFSSGG